MIASSTILAAETPTVVTAAIAAGAALLSAAVTVAGGIYASRRRVIELEVEYRQKQQDRYLENAQKHLPDIYLPLHQALAALVGTHKQLRVLADAETRELPVAARASLDAACQRYLAQVDTLLQNDAAGAFLTSDLEEHLEDFDQFLRDSLGSTEVQRRIALRAEIFGLSLARSFTTSHRHSFLGAATYMPPFLLGASLQVDQDHILSAPLGSVAFQERFVSDTARLRALIKQVTLGDR